MPELPEVETTKQGIEPFILHQKVQSVIIRNARLRWEITPSLKNELPHQKIEAVIRRGKYLLLQTKNRTVLIHLGMSGRLKILSATKSTPAGKHDHVDFIFANGTCLRLTDPRKFGCVLWIDNTNEHPLLKSIGPEPLEKKFNADYLFAKTRCKKVAIKNFLMNAKNVAGIGNIYAVEALFLAGIRPTRAARSLHLLECKNLVSAVKKILKAAIKKGGTTFRDFAQSDGKPGYFIQHLNVYDRAGLTCRQCKTTLKAIKQGQRSTVFCPKCQR